MPPFHVVDKTSCSNAYTCMDTRSPQCFYKAENPGGSSLSLHVTFPVHSRPPSKFHISNMFPWEVKTRQASCEGWKGLQLKQSLQPTHMSISCSGSSLMLPRKEISFASCQHAYSRWWCFCKSRRAIEEVLRSQHVHKTHLWKRPSPSYPHMCMHTLCPLLVPNLHPLALSNVLKNLDLLLRARLDFQKPSLCKMYSCPLFSIQKKSLIKSLLYA